MVDRLLQCVLLNRSFQTFAESRSVFCSFPCLLEIFLVVFWQKIFYIRVGFIKNLFSNSLWLILPNYVWLWSIHSCSHWWKNYKNRPRNTRVMVENKCLYFYGTPCICDCPKLPTYCMCRCLVVMTHIDSWYCKIFYRHLPVCQLTRRWHALIGTSFLSWCCG